MYGYAASSASAGTLEPLMSPAPATNPGAQTAGLSGLVSNLPNAVQALAVPAQVTSPFGALDDIFNNNLLINVGQSAADVVSWNMFASIARGILTQNASAATGPIAAAGSAGSLVSTGAPASFGGAPVLAGMGTASPLGKLSVPAGWSAATPASTRATTLAGWTAPAEETQMTALPAGMPAVASAGRGGYAMGPRYGVQPKVMPTQVFV